MSSRSWSPIPAPATLPIGVPDIKLLDKEVNAYAAIGLFDGQVPDITTLVNTTMVQGVYDDAGHVIWPPAERPADAHTDRRRGPHEQG